MTTEDNLDAVRETIAGMFGEHRQRVQAAEHDAVSVEQDRGTAVRDLADADDGFLRLCDEIDYLAPELADAPRQRMRRAKAALDALPAESVVRGRRGNEIRAARQDADELRDALVEARPVEPPSMRAPASDGGEGRR